MIKINGINHSRYVGIDNEGQPCAFNPENAGGYREPITKEEIQACIEEARAYYDICIPRVQTGPFSYTHTDQKEVEAVGEISASESLYED